MASEDVQSGAFAKFEQTATLSVPGGAKANIKSAPAVLRRTENATKKTTEERVFLLDLDLYMEGNTPLGHAAAGAQCAQRQRHQHLPQRHHRHAA